MNFLFNWAYIDHDHIAYVAGRRGCHSARRARRPDFPILGTGEYDWKGYDPRRHTAKWLPARKHPQAVDPPYLVSWNNKQAPGWAAADDSLHVRADPSLAADRGPRVKRGITGQPQDVAARARAGDGGARDRGPARGEGPARSSSRRWANPRGKARQGRDHRSRTGAAHGAHRRDLDGDGSYEFDKAVVLMDAWWPLAVQAQFGPALGQETFDALENMIPLGAPVGPIRPRPDFFDGWYGYASKDLRALLGPSRAAPTAGSTAARARRPSAAPRCAGRSVRRSPSRPRSSTPTAIARATQRPIATTSTAPPSPPGSRSPRACSRTARPSSRRFR